MEPPSKRAKVAHAPDEDDNEANDDELSLSTTQFDARQDPMYELDKKRAKSAFKLKSRFESIFEKYEKDFEGIGDEIDLRTGDIVVNNGHLQSLDDDKEKSEDDEEDHERLAHEEKSNARFGSMPRPPPRPSSHGQYGWQAHTGLLPNSSPNSSFPGMPLPAEPPANGSVDPVWQTPELRAAPLQGDVGLVSQGLGSLYINQGALPPLFGAHGYGGMLAAFGRQPYKRLATAKDLAARSLVGPTLDGEGQENEREDDDESDDEILMATAEDGAKNESQPRNSKSTVKTVVLSTISQRHVQEARPSIGTTVPAPAETPVRRRPGRPRKNPLPSSGVIITPAPNLTKKTGSETIITGSESEEVLPRNSTTIVQTKHTSLTTALADGQLLTTDDSSDSQGRRSSRARKRPELYGAIRWQKTRQPRQDVETLALTPPPEARTTHDEETAQELPTPKQRQQVESTVTSTADEVSWSQVRDSAPSDVLASENTNASSLLDGSIADAQEPRVSLSKQTAADSELPRYSLPRSTLGDENKHMPDATGREPALEVLTEQQIYSSPTSANSAREHRRNTEEPLGEHISNLELPEITERQVADADGRGDRENTGEEDNADEDNTEEDFADVSIELGELTVSEARSPTDIDGDTSLKGSSAIRDTIPESPGQVEIPERAPEVLIDLETGVPEASDSQDSVKARAERSSPRPSQSPSTDPEQFYTPEDELTSRELTEPTSTRATISESQSPMARSRPQTPTTRPNSTKPTSTGRGTSTGKRKRVSLISLVPDFDDDDEDDNLSVFSSSVARTPTTTASLRASFTHAAEHRGQHHPLSSSPGGAFSSPPAATPRRSRTHGSSLVAATTPRHTKPTRAAAPGSSPHHADSRRRSSATAGGGGGGTVHSSPLRRSVLMLQSTPRKHRVGARDGGSSSRAASPGGSPIRTPGRLVLRCGVAGFECGREFCLTCCK
jgi:hypothetical protein